jgi:hypothetical protein
MQPNPSQPIPAIPVLNYAGPTVPQRPAFNARRTWTWKGEHLFRIYLTPARVYFIRIGGARTHETVAMTQFGLLGGLIAWWAAKHRKKQEQKKVLQNEEKPIEQLMTEHKRNHAIDTSDFSHIAVETGGFWSGGGIKWTFNVPGEKKRVTLTLDKPEDVEAAVLRLPQLFNDMRVGVEFNERKKKFVKKR